MFITVATLAIRQHKIGRALEASRHLSTPRRILDAGSIVAPQKYTLFHVTVPKSETLPRAMHYIQSAVQLFRKDLLSLFGKSSRI